MSPPSLFRVEAEDQSEISLEFEVAAVPTVVFFTNGKLIDRIEGAKVRERDQGKMD